MICGKNLGIENQGHQGDQGNDPVGCHPGSTDAKERQTDHGDGGADDDGADHFSHLAHDAGVTQDDFHHGCDHDGAGNHLDLELPEGNARTRGHVLP